MSRQEAGVASRALRALDITVARARAELVRLVRPGDVGAIRDVGRLPFTHRAPFTPRAKKVLECSLRESLRLGHHYIRPEHILLALVRENDGVAARILLELDADADKIRSEILRLLPDWTPKAPGPGPAGTRSRVEVVPWHTTDQS
jgi:ATP-dependent Clp protease ATP-binding subunit ClpC